MDATREHLLGRVLLERRLLTEEDLRRVIGERDELIRRGGRATLAQILVRERRIEAGAVPGLQNEIELRGRACFTCRRAYLVAPGGPPLCPSCGGPALLPALASAVGSSTAAAPAPAPVAVDDYSPSGRFPPISPSGRFAHPNGSTLSRTAAAGSSARGNPFANGSALASGSSRLIPSLIASPQPQTAPDTKVGSDAGSSGGNGVTRQGAELKTLGSYDLLAELGRGGMGVVYKAQHRQTGQIVALKVLLSGEFASPKMLARFKEEAAVVQKLDHPNIVPIFEVGEIDGINYFTMKFVEGDLFQALLKGRGLSARRGAEIVRDVARGAHHAHETGIVHRDLKPANVIVERESGTPYIMDFGLAKDLEDDKGLSKTGVAIGTPYYMPPEQAQGKHREIDARSDVYALGAMLYEVLARKVPFNAESQTLLLRKIVEEEPVPPSQIRQGVPPDLETIALKSLKKKKDDRYASAEALAKDVERALSGKQIKAKRDPFWTPLVRKLQKHPKVIGIVLLCLVLVAGAVAFAWHVHAEAERRHAEEELKKQQEEAERKRHEEEEAALKRRAEAETWLSKGHAKRLQAKLSPNFAAARVVLDDAVEAFGNAIKLTDPGSEPNLGALYERSLCTLAARRREGLAGAVDDLHAVANSKTHVARARLALGVAALRRDHDQARARDEFDVGKTPGQPSEPAAKRDEEAAALVCGAYLTAIDGDAAGAIRLAQQAAAKSDDFALESGAAEAWVRLENVQGPGPESQAIAKLVDRLVAQERWHYALQCDRTHVHAIDGELQIAAEAMQAVRDIDSEAIDGKLIDGWIRTAISNQNDGEPLRSLLDEARRDQPTVGRYWDSLERRYTSAWQTLRKALVAKQRSKEPGAGDKPKDKPNHNLWSDIRFDIPEAAKGRIADVRQLAGDGKREDAILALKKLVDDYPDYPGLKCWLALHQIEMHRVPEATALVDVVLSKNAEFAFGLTIRALLAGEAGDVATAKDTFDKVIKDNPGLRTPRMLYAMLLNKTNEWAAAETVVKPVFEADSTDVEAADVLAYVWMHLEKVEAALKLSSAIVKVRPRDLEARLTMAGSLRRLKRWDDELRTVEEGLKFARDDCHLVAEHGFALWGVGRADEAEKEIARARSLATTPEEQKSLDKAWNDLRAKGK